MNNTNNQATILVAGATGILGSEICRQLLAANKKVKALVRASSDSNKVAGLVAAGATIAVGDLKDKASLKKAMEGVTAVVSTVSCTFSRQEGDSIQTVDDEGQGNLVDAATTAKVNQFVFISFCNMNTDFPLQAAKRKTEKRLTGSGINYTILQPTFFMEAWLSPALGFDYPNAKANIYGEGENKISWIAVKDVAAFAVAALGNEAAVNQVFELGGPEALSPLQVVKIFETRYGKPFAVEFVPTPALEAQKKGAPDPLSESFAALMLGFAGGSKIEMKKTNAAFTVPLHSVGQYAEKL